MQSNLLQRSSVLNLHRIWVLSSLTQNGNAIACPLVRRSPLVLGVVDLAVADVVLAGFDQAPLALAGRICCLQSLIQVFVKIIQRHLYPLQCDQRTSCCCVQIQVAVAWDELFTFV